MIRRPSPHGSSSDVRRYTRGIRFLGVGTDEQKARYLVLQIGEQRTVMRVAHLMSSQGRGGELVRLERAGVPLVALTAQNEFISEVQKEAGKAPTFRIVTKTGWDGPNFYFPDRVVPKKATRVEFYLDESLSEIYQKFRRAGTRPETNELLSLYQNNSRLLTCVALSFVGPLLAPLAGETVGVQLCGAPGKGKSVTGIVASSTWGWDPRPNHKLGFGTGWNTTLNATEPTLAGYNETMAFLNETRIMSDEGRRGREAAILDVIMLAAEGQGKARLPKAGTKVYQTPILSTSNLSVVAMLDAAKIPFDAAYLDRMIDVPAPGNGSSFFEDLHGYPDLETFGIRLQELAQQNHGWLGFYFVTELAKALVSDRAEVIKFFKARRQAYRRQASKIVAPGRNLNRVHGKLATVYAAGCFAFRFKLLPFNRAELLGAILTCERDHVAFVAKELGEAVASTGNPVAAATLSPYARLKAYVFGPARKKFIDLRRDGARVPAGHRHRTAFGYLGLHEGIEEIWLPNTRFEQVVGGRSAGNELKAELHAEGHIAIDERDGDRYYTVKRDIAGVGRVRVVALWLEQQPR